jgi:nucleotide-binding universal stress UspA family protein
MQRIASILAATDLSANAEWGVRRAARLASEHGCALRLLNVREADTRQLDGRGTSDDALLDRKLDAMARKQLDALAEGLWHAFAARPQLCTIRGEAVGEIIAAAESRTDLLVLGSGGRHPWRQMLMGSTAERVVRKARKPVLVVKRPPHAPYRRALIVADIAQDGWSIPPTALPIARSANVVLLQVLDFPFEAKLKFAGVPQAKIDDHRRRRIDAAQKGLQALADALPGHASALCLTSTGDPAQAIAEQVIKMEADLVVLTRPKSLIEDILLGSVSRRVLWDVGCDVLIEIANSTRISGQGPCGLVVKRRREYMQPAH